MVKLITDVVLASLAGWAIARVITGYLIAS